MFGPGYKYASDPFNAPVHLRRCSAVSKVALCQPRLCGTQIRGPSVIAISLLEVKQPSTWYEYPDSLQTTPEPLLNRFPLTDQVRSHHHARHRLLSSLRIRRFRRQPLARDAPAGECGGAGTDHTANRPGAMNNEAGGASNSGAGNSRERSATSSGPATAVPRSVPHAASQPFSPPPSPDVSPDGVRQLSSRLVQLFSSGSYEYRRRRR